jgi:hypothetical protein
LDRELEQLISQMRSRLATLRSEQSPEVPQLRLLYEEIAAADAEFDGVKLDTGEISVTTGPITLDDIELGRFKIRLHLKLLGADTPYTIQALDPNPAVSCSETTHPHVSGERLCPGEGRAAINAALAEGRIGDFFLIVDRILHTYAVGSAYVELDQWYGIRCHDCDSTVDEEDASSCTNCAARVCGDCLVGCGGCGEGYCSGCIDRCYRCEEYSCSGCLTTCVRCRHAVCGACCEEELCETCREELEDELDEMELLENASAETVDVSAEPTV